MGQFHNIVEISRTEKIDIEYIGEKAFELGELKYLGIPIPEGFVIQTSFFKKFLEITGISEDIQRTRKTYHPSLSDSVDKLFEPVRKKIIHTHIPHILALELHKHYRKLAGKFNETSVDIFSSSKINKSMFFLNIKGDANIVFKIKAIWSSFMDNPVAIVIMKNIKSKINGKIFTNSPTIDQRLTEEQMIKLSDYCKIIQRHFYFPKETEYSINEGEIFITNIKPFTYSAIDPFKSRVQDNKKQKMLIKGISLNPGIATGPVKILRNNFNNVGIKKGDIIIIPNFDSSLFKNIKYAKAVIFDSVLPNSLNKALYRRGFQIPTVEGVSNATKMFRDGSIVTVNGTNGEIHSGGLLY